MKIRLNYEQMYALWREGMELEPALNEASVERFDSVEVEKRIARRMRAWYVDYLHTAPVDMLPISDLTPYVRIERGPGNSQWTLKLMCDVARILGVTVKGYGALQLIDPQDSGNKEELYRLRNKFVRHGRQRTAFYTPGSDRVILNFECVNEPEIIEVVGVEVTDDEVYVIDERMLDKLGQIEL